MATALHVIGRCLIVTNKFSYAKEYLENALKNEQQVSNDLATDKGVATTLHVTGQSLIAMHNFLMRKSIWKKR